ncbi:MAG: alpha/beta fold hydrolase [Rickettsiaceae bacterium]|jgi:pimeloyl-ACP methyl ester carboxylesterase|nr:alpha/beta fold hydrolase [Rickettsiaceae bacterium]
MEKFVCTVLAFLSIIFSLSSFAEPECVIILHGFGQTNRAMAPIKTFLQDYNYKVINVTYPSRTYDIENLANLKIKPQLTQCLNQAEKVHFVGYSMGGVIARYIIENNAIKNLGKVVLIASPIKGSDISSKLSKNSMFKFLFGPAVADLASDSILLKNLKKNVSYPVGIITASKSHNPITSLFLLPGKNDGTVTLASTEIEGLRDRISIDANHNSVIYLKETHQQILNFIKLGRFVK